MRPIDLTGAPADATPTEQRNYLYVQIEGMGIGITLAAAAFLPIFLTRLGATNFQIGLLSAMPGVTGFFLAIAAGRFLQTRRSIVPWFSTVRLLNALAYALTGLVPFFVPREYVVAAVLGIWALVTVPQTLSGIAFSVVMSAVAGPRDRYTLMSRRWSLVGLLNATTTAAVGQILTRTGFPINYQVVFLALSIAGIAGSFFTRRVQLPDVEPPRSTGRSLRNIVAEYGRMLRDHPAFLSFSLKRFVFMSGMLFTGPLLSIYFVREVQATDAWIGAISTIHTAVTLVGYFVWAWQSRVRGSRFVLLATTAMVALYPMLVGLTRSVALIAAFAALDGLFQAGLNLVFFDELMKTVPSDQAPIFVALAQNLQYVSTIVAPIVGTSLADAAGIGISGALFVGAGIRLAGFLLFALPRRSRITR